MSGFDGEPEFGDHAEEAGESVCTAVRELTNVRAYVLSEDELEEFKQAQLALRELHRSFHEQHDCSHQQ